MTRIVIVDDHPIILSGVAALLRDGAFDIVGTFTDGAEALERLDDLRPDILIVDLQMPRMSGLDVLRAARDRGDGISVVLLTAAIGDRDAAEAVRLGVNGLVLKDTAPELLLLCLSQVRDGRQWIDQPVLQRMLDLDAARELTPTPLATLSQRERAVMDGVVQGWRNREIAEALGIAEGTVKVHLHNVYEKLGVGSRTELVIFANGLAG